MCLNYGLVFRCLWTKVHQITRFSSRDIRNRSVKSSEIAPKKAYFWPQIFLGGEPQILDLVYKIAPITDHVTKFCGDWPRDHGDLALNKKNSSKT